MKSSLCDLPPARRTTSEPLLAAAIRVFSHRVATGFLASTRGQPEWPTGGEATTRWPSLPVSASVRSVGTTVVATGSLPLRAHPVLGLDPPLLAAHFELALLLVTLLLVLEAPVLLPRKLLSAALVPVLIQCWCCCGILHCFWQITLCLYRCWRSYFWYWMHQSCRQGNCSQLP